MERRVDLAVIGGGASGMAAAIAAGRLGDRVAVFESAPRPCRKLLASGNGRCNLMNTGNPRYFGDAAFASSVLSHAGCDTVRGLMDSLGVLLVPEEDDRVYPATGQASTVADALKNGLKSVSAGFFPNAEIRRVSRVPDGFTLVRDGEKCHAGRVLVACGGPASPRLGGTESGYDILRSFGHRIIDPRPALCPLTTDRKSVSGLSGIRVRCAVTLADPSGRPIHREQGEVLFTDYGVSGICVMQCARFLPEGPCVLELDLISRFFPEEEALSRELHARRERFGDASPEALLNGILLPKLSYAVLKQAGIPLRGERLCDLDDRALSSVASVLRRYRLNVTGTRGLDAAQVTAGGADCREFCPSTMESLLVPGLFASGEVLDVDGDCGGFNLLFAFSSGILAGANGRDLKGVVIP